MQALCIYNRYIECYSVDIYYIYIPKSCNLQLLDSFFLLYLWSIQFMLSFFLSNLIFTCKKIQNINGQGRIRNFLQGGGLTYPYFFYPLDKQEFYNVLTESLNITFQRGFNNNSLKPLFLLSISFRKEQNIILSIINSIFLLEI